MTKQLKGLAGLKARSSNVMDKLRSKIDEEEKGGNFTDDRMWAPTVDKAGNGFAVIRFIPAPDSSEGETSDYVRRYSHGFKVGAKWFIENCPTTINQPCPVCEANSEKWNTGIKAEQDTVRERKRQLSYYSNILVISDKANPENEGKVFIFRFGSKIFGKIKEALKPEFEDEVSFNPYDFWTGANFLLKIRNVEGRRNYDKSSFENQSALFDGNDAKIEEVWKQGYDLQEFIQEAEFKSYTELKRKFIAVTGIASQQFNDYVEDSADDQKPTRTSSKNTQNDLDQDDIALYSKLIGDDDIPY